MKQQGLHSVVKCCIQTFVVLTECAAAPAPDLHFFHLLSLFNPGGHVTLRELRTAD